ncbi:FtsW/RodA/SpoVE family cell cycle protein [Amnibacterium sp. CER49]|uniref:FtsW/RodA/SpoVE family cell cycle protein n=1 Tax=Amnibacterium sp. CER49 TaxID=3039161 RepID=UPI00244AD2D3|nr:FtsW/RodA/SpoVE family cell cycle protein [Amnibacterium sp. CER49]MDH2442371.1 FtsW/RodA/SpoVE family cell cycle protein [Amnibacterium sp. CER49]
MAMTTVLERPAPTAAPRLRRSTRLRNIELGLLLLAVGVSASAILLVQLGALGRIDSRIAALTAVPAAAVLALHVVLRFVAPDADPFIVPIATALNGVGIAEVYRIDLSPTGIANHTDDGTKQIVWTALAVAAAIVVLLVVRNHRRLQRYTYLSMVAAVVLLLLPLVPGLRVANAGADVWIHVGPLSFQPAELGKLFLAFFFTGFLTTRRDALATVGRRVLGHRLPRGRDLGPILVVWIVALLVIVGEHALGTGVLIFGMFVAMLYVATGRRSWPLFGLLLAAAGGWASAQLLPYIDGRFVNWLSAFDGDLYNQPGGSFQLVNGIFGLAHGGLFGTGLGLGRPDLTPAADSDFIVASIGEEIGLVGLFALLCLYLLFVARGLRVAFSAPDDYGTLLAAGLAFEFALQCFVVIGGVLRVMPEAGLTTPFLAAGGSSLLANWMLAALLLRISDTVRSAPRTTI